MKLKLKHIGKLDTKIFDLKQGVTTVLGENGMGKSTLVNALYLALTGETIDGSVLEDKVTWDHDTGSVTLETEQWTVTRTIGKKSSVLLTDNTDLRLTKKAEVNDYIFKYYNISSADILKEVYFAAQYRAIDILETTPAKRLDMLASVFGFSKYDRAQKRIYQQLAQIPEVSVNKELITSIENQLSDIDKQIAEVGASVEASKKNLDAIPDEQSLIEKMNAQTEDDVQELKEAQDTLNKTLDNVYTAFKELSAYNLDMSKLESRVGEYRQYIETVDALNVLKKDMEEIQKDMPTATERIRELKEQSLSERADLQMQLKQLQERKDMLKDGLCPLSKTPPCSGLLKLADPDILNTQIQELTNNLSTLEEDLKGLAAMETASVQAYKRYCENDAKQAQLKNWLSQHKELENNNPSTEELKEVDDYLSKKPEIEKDLKDLEVKNQDLRNSLAVCEAKLKDIKVVSKEEQELAKKQYSERLGLLQAIAAHEADLKHLNDRKDDSTRLLETLKADLDKADDINFKRQVLAATRQVLSRDYLPRLMMESIVQQLNNHLLYYINLFGFKYNCKVMTDGDFLFLNEADKWVSTKHLSGGQKYLVAIMLKLASAATIRTSFPFYVLDEPTTGLDYQNRQLLADLFKDMEAKLKPLYLVIPTHDSEVAEVATNKIIIGE